MADYSPVSHNTQSQNYVDITHNIDQSIGNRLAVDIRVTQITEPVFNAALDLAYDPTVIRFLFHVSGDFFERTPNPAGGISYAVEPQSDAPNDLVIGISKTGSDPGSTGSGILVTLVFEPVKPGCSVLNFVTSKSALIQPNGSVLSSVVFSQGGIIRVRQEGDTEECRPDPQNP